tara:strand:+ start:122 stop:655 length:534 start_codon:yes stop_codon:yes gene_type:complete
MLKSILVLIFVLSILISCSQIRESAGVTRKALDEYQTVESPPLVIPPDFNLLPPDQLEEKKVEDIEKELAEEILFGLDKNNEDDKKEISTMNQILSKSEANEVTDNIRQDIDENFSQEKKTDEIFQTNWEDEQEILDALEESKRLRESNFENNLNNDDIPIKTEKVKIKKKKRFFFF